MNSENWDNISKCEISAWLSCVVVAYLMIIVINFQRSYIQFSSLFSCRPYYRTSEFLNKYLEKKTLYELIALIHRWIHSKEIVKICKNNLDESFCKIRIFHLKIFATNFSESERIIIQSIVWNSGIPLFWSSKTHQSVRNQKLIGLLKNGRWNQEILRRSSCKKSRFWT